MLSAMGRREECLHELDRVLTDPAPAELRTYSWAFSLRAWALHALGRNGEAAACLDRAVREVAVPAPEVFARRGVHWEAGDLQQAERCFERAIADRADYSWGLLGHGVTLAYSGRPDNAVVSFTRAFAIQTGVAAPAAEQTLARPLAELLTTHLPTHRDAITAGVRLAALLCWSSSGPTWRPRSPPCSPTGRAPVFSLTPCGSCAPSPCTSTRLRRPQTVSASSGPSAW
ncbi:tetratricopeptide repeat protein [Streptomyces sp. NPDC060194]|uniref:tetratricopeptide repeat protein n=1 Tax=Streptomyces sp. NPDC060194 TaxID=3347069 RepID=UPI0036556063